MKRVSGHQKFKRHCNHFFSTNHTASDSPFLLRERGFIKVIRVGQPLAG
ncbi:MAG: hypothetical protein WCI64_01465 [Chlorobium sp.]